MGVRNRNTGGLGKKLKGEGTFLDLLLSDILGDKGKYSVERIFLHSTSITPINSDTKTTPTFKGLLVPKPSMGLLESLTRLSDTTSPGCKDKGKLLAVSADDATARKFIQK